MTPPLHQRSTHRAKSAAARFLGMSLILHGATVGMVSQDGIIAEMEFGRK
jgi:hypothetical protein